MKNNNDNELSIIEFQLKFSIIKYNEEIRREESLLRQCGNMQTAFSFVIAALFVVAPLIIEYRGMLSLRFLFIAFSSISITLIASLFVATLGQQRKRQTQFPSAKDQVEYIASYKDKFQEKIHRKKFLLNTYCDIQKSLTDNNQYRTKCVRLSMILFYLSLFLCLFWFFVGICKVL